MSDNWIILIPEDPRYVPDSYRQEQARALFAEIAPDVDEIKIRTSFSIEFVDCGGNFESVACPVCQEILPVEWWVDRVEEDILDGEFQLFLYTLPCCDDKLTLNELKYDWPQGFSRFALEAMNPNIGSLHENTIKEFETILGSQLRVIYRVV
jgi:hypothetical protein